MILTPDFVYIHYPKTGGTFVTHVLSRIYEGRGFADVDKHAACEQIPEEHRGKPIVTSLRNPFERYVSQYRFAWWKLHPDLYCGVDEMKALYPHYPDLTFAEFVHMANTKFLNCYERRPTGFVNRNFPPGRELGWHTEQFVRFFFRNPREVYARLDEESLERGDFRKDMYPVRFLPVERLNEALYELLLGFGHAPEEIDFVRSADKVFPVEGGRAPGDRWESYYTPEIRDYIRTRERLLFQLFPQFDTVEEGVHA
jgi:Sulfotransferase family